MTSTEQLSDSGGGVPTSLEPRLCENVDCKIAKLIPMVGKQKVTQFVTAPTIVEKPLLINGLSAVFQTCGSSAKLSDIKKNKTEKANENAAAVTENDLKPIYRIKPDTHVHIVNYIVVEDDSDVLRKINEGDPETLRILVDSQRVSAEHKLKKMMGNTKTDTLNATDFATVVEAAPAVTNSESQTIAAGVSEQRNNNTETSANITNTAPHLNLSIANVAESMPFLSTVQCGTSDISMPVAAMKPSGFAAPVLGCNAEGISIDKMQEELQELRRTVARLAAQAGNRK